MTTQYEVLRWIKDAQASLNSAKNSVSLKDWRNITINAQLCIELSSKAIIAYFTEPLWTHNPANQLSKIIKEYELQIIDKFDKEMIDDLIRIAQSVQDSAPWHGWATYGKEAEDGLWIPAVELCTEEIATKFLDKAVTTFNTVSEFFKKIFE